MSNLLTLEIKKIKNDNRIVTPDIVDNLIRIPLDKRRLLVISSIDDEFFSHIRHEIKNVLNHIVLAEYEYYENNNFSKKAAEIVDKMISKEYFEKSIRFKD